MDIVADAQKVRLEAAELLHQVQSQGSPDGSIRAFERAPSGLLVPAASAPVKDLRALEDAAVKLANAHARLAAYDDKGVMSFESVMVSAELRACLAGLTAITTFLASSNAAAGAAAALEPGAFRKSPGGLWVPAKAS